VALAFVAAPSLALAGIVPDLVIAQRITVKLTETYTVPGLKENGVAVYETEKTKKVSSSKTVTTNRIASKKAKTKIDNKVILETLIDTGVITGPIKGWSIVMLTSISGSSGVYAVNGEETVNLDGLVDYEKLGLAAKGMQKIVSTKEEDILTKEEILGSEKAKYTLSATAGYGDTFIEAQGIACESMAYDKKTGGFTKNRSTKIISISGVFYNSPLGDDSDFDGLDGLYANTIIQGSVSLKKAKVVDFVFIESED